MDDMTPAPIWYVFNQSDMCSPEQPMRIYLKTVDMNDMIPYVAEKTAKRVNVPYRSHVSLGHYECGACGQVVDAGDKFCKQCGAGLEDE
jgi:hypothetical protein